MTNLEKPKQTSYKRHETHRAHVPLIALVVAAMGATPSRQMSIIANRIVFTLALIAGILLGVQDTLASSTPIPCPLCPPANPLSGLSSPQKLLVIAPDKFLPALQPLVDHKNSTGMPTVVVSLSSLTRFFTGNDDPEKIKRAIQYAHENLATQYVMLAGDASWVPARFESWHGLTGGYPVDGDYISSDLYYANLYHHALAVFGSIQLAIPIGFDNWDANGNQLYNEGYWEANGPNPDNVDGYPDVAVGRVPAHTASDVTAFVNKVIFYETQPLNHWFFTFVGDGNYQPISLSTDIVANSGLKAWDVFPLINPPANPPTPWFSADAAQVASVANASTWVSYVGHGSRTSWDGIGSDLVQDMANNTALPVVFAAGCSTGAFTPEAPGVNTYQYQDVSGQLRYFVARTVFGRTRIVDMFTGQTWGLCPGCRPLPMTTPQPNPYDFNERDPGFAYPWLMQYPNGGAIAYFGEVSVATDSMGVELETDMLADYQRGDRVLGSIYQAGEQAYFWNNYQLNNGVPQGGGQLQQPPRYYLGWMVFFGDPSLRMR